MIPSKGYAVYGSDAVFKSMDFKRREPGPNDVVIQILYCGICHSDIHQVKNEWKRSVYPMIPGHEIVGMVSAVGTAVKKFKLNDKVGVGCFVDSCRTCLSCHEGFEQYCENHLSLTYNGTEQDRKTPTYGGYSNNIVVDENYVVQIPENLPLDACAPLLCAGVTTYSPLSYLKVEPNQRVGVMGLGGLGHMALKFSVAMGAETSVISHSLSKYDDAVRLGSKHFISTQNRENLTKFSNYFDVLIDAISAPHDPNLYLELLRREGTLVVVGIPEESFVIEPFSLIAKRRRVLGSLIGGIAETQEMLNFCGKHGITSDIELIPIQKISEAYDRMIAGDVRYRFVIDMKTM